MSRQLRPRKPKEESEEELYADELKAERNKYNYQKRRRYILAKRKAEREANPQLFIERSRKYREANREKINERQRKKFADGQGEIEWMAEARKRKEFENKREELRKEYPYEFYRSNYDNLMKLGAIQEAYSDNYSNITYIPRDKNRFWCANKQTYYKYTGEKNMTVYRFFAKVALHDCKKEDHGHQREGYLLYDPHEKEKIKEELKRKAQSSK